MLFLLPPVTFIDFDPGPLGYKLGALSLTTKPRVAANNASLLLCAFFLLSALHVLLIALS